MKWTWFCAQKQINGPITQRTGGWYDVCCPAHPDTRPSLSVKVNPRGDVKAFKCHAGCSPAQILAVFGLEPDELKCSARWSNGVEIEDVYDYTDERGTLLFQVERRMNPKSFRQRRPDPLRPNRRRYDVKGVRRVLYRLPELQGHAVVVVVEGEKAADAVAELGLAATTNPGGAGKWDLGYTTQLITAGAETVALLPDHDATGRNHMRDVARSCRARGLIVKIIELPGLPPKGDAVEWIAAGGTCEALLALVAAAPAVTLEHLAVDEEATAAAKGSGPVGLADFFAYMPIHRYLYVPSRDLWPAASVNGRIAPMPGPSGKDDQEASDWLDRNRPIEQMTWAPGEPPLIRDRLIHEGGWVAHAGVTVFNLYQPPTLALGDAAQAEPWLAHVRFLYPDEAEHLLSWLAHRVQRPGEKINHALVLGGAPGIGKDTLLEPVTKAIGPWNFHNISPTVMMGRFNGWVKAVILRVSEARDLGEVSRFTFYDHLKVYTAAPPDVLRVDEKNLREYVVPNVCGVVLTTNHKTDGIYLPADDRRHYVAWSERVKEEFSEAYWTALWRWYLDGGCGHVAAYLTTYDLSAFNPKAPPPQTEAFFALVDAARAPEEDDLATLLAQLGRPAALTLDDLVAAAYGLPDFRAWLEDRKNRRALPHRLDEAGYLMVPNRDDRRGRWNIGGRQRVVYARRELGGQGRYDAALDLATGRRLVRRHPVAGATAGGGGWNETPG